MIKMKAKSISSVWLFFNKFFKKIMKLTRDSYTKLMQELEKKKTTIRKEISNKIRDTKEFGDLSENTAYDNAREQEAFNEGRIKELENILREAKIITINADKSKVSIGDTVELSYDNKKIEVIIVDSQQANPEEKKISIESPLGKAILKHKQGDIIDVETPNGKITYKVIKIK
ncbi:MAG: Transcription elongation factor GreA [Candidatus Roizmanbacteria bacterium GW2011_GWA2_32_13]|uniref:Transcription elongation factor GreA n=1 Tax=Candidatus Roizmanbacteria bacterium GW2011_GWA2_32_13 TaxID=1618475 RepID=A0A0G0BC48_9BACT|nr:MAG: Transcription elongation factor GreA [Candidatus Roizmanbacteria bacterium GW2011_GWA2_32_13]